MSQIPEWLNLVLRDFAKREHGLICSATEECEPGECDQTLVYILSGSSFSLRCGDEFDLFVTLDLDEQAPKLLLCAWRNNVSTKLTELPLSGLTLKDFKIAALKHLHYLV